MREGAIKPPTVHDQDLEISKSDASKTKAVPRLTLPRSLQHPVRLRLETLHFNMLRPKDLCQGSGTKTFLDAMNSGKVHLARFVLDALDGRIINSKTESTRTPLMFAVCLQDHSMRSKFTHLLLEKGADVNSQDEHGRTALSLACELGHLDVVKVLVQFNADPELTDSWGNSALIYAAYGGHSQVLEFLIRAFKRLGLKLERTNHAGHSAVQIADYLGHTQCVQMLTTAGRKGLCSIEQTEEMVGETQGETSRPNRLPRQILERFSKQFHNKNEELPALFQKQVRIGDNGNQRRRLSQHQSPERNNLHSYQSLTRFSEKHLTEDVQHNLFTSKQMQNSTLRSSGTTRKMNGNLERSKKEEDDKQEPRDNAPMWGKAKSFNLDLRSGRKQSYQGDVHDCSQSASKFKRASLQDEKPLIAKFYSRGNTSAKITDSEKTGKPQTELVNGVENGDDKSKRDSLKYPSVLKNGRQNKLLFSREEMAPERIHIRPAGLGGLGTRLLRRFTAPEFMRLVREYPSGAGLNKGKMARSETFPFSHTHRIVNSQPSVDSISGVRCEFEGSPPVNRS